MDKIEKFVDKWVEKRHPEIGGNSAYDYSLDKSDLFHLVRDFSEQEWHTPDEKPKEGKRLLIYAPLKAQGIQSGWLRVPYISFINGRWNISGASQLDFIWGYKPDVPQPTEEDWKLLDK